LNKVLLAPLFPSRKRSVLPPVELIQVDGFFVQDGHHRISVAKALGEDYVDAEVIDLDC
jgi:ParB-like chromosome segregation protein Spo0J